MQAIKLVLTLLERKTRYVLNVFTDLHSIFRRILRTGLFFALTIVRAVPFVKPLVKNLVELFPKVNLHLHAFASAHRPNQPKSTLAGLTQKTLQSPRFASPIFYDDGKEISYALPKGGRIIYYYVDHTVGCPVNTGMQRLVRGLARSLLESGERLCFVKWNFDSQEFELINRDELAYLARWQGPEHARDELYDYPEAGSPSVVIPTQQIGAANWLLVPEVTHINNHPAAVTLDVVMAAKRLRLKSAFVFYDAIPLRRKELIDMTPKHEQYMQQLLLADLVVPISDWSASDLTAFFTYRELATQNTIPKIVAIHLTGESKLTARATEISRTTRKLILSIGSITPHKNQLALVKAFEAFVLRYPGSGWELAVLGNIHDDLISEITAFEARIPEMRVLKDLSDEELARQLNECAFTVFPSVMEGFGLPILESLWHGKPCVCANFGAMAEVATGGGCLMVDVRNSDAILAAIEQLAFEPAIFLQLQVEALERPMRSWRDYANDFNEVLDEVSTPLNQIGVVYYWVHHTCAYHSNTGIQRVVRGMARGLMEVGVILVPIKWDLATQSFTSPTEEELIHLSQWNGPSIDGWAPWRPPQKSSLLDWLLIPELLSAPQGPSNFIIKRYASEHHLRTACVFYDAIPYKLTDFYTQDEAQRHGEYMRGLNEFELTLSISEFSRRDLIGFLQGLVDDKTLNLEDRMLACVLPAEFYESKRVVQTPPNQPDVPIRILCVCTVEPRKNHLTLIKAFKRLINETDKKIELCLVGGDPFPELAEQIQREIEATPSIRWERKADDSRLRELYDECNFTVYPSLEEGFGLPILESLWYARPCICRDASAMAEVAAGGGCLKVETANVETLAAAMMQLVSDFNLRDQLAKEAVMRPFRTWQDYTSDVVMMMANERQLPNRQKLPLLKLSSTQFKQEAINLLSRPLLSICISTYNRAAWLKLSLQNLQRLIPIAQHDIEIVVCDNTSTDNTPEVVKPFIGRSDFRYYRNLRNVGMLGNLRVTAHHARGRHIWVLGDDDLIMPGSIEHVLEVLRAQPDLTLLYLNYAYSNVDNAKAVNLDYFLDESTPVVVPCLDISGSVSRISTQSQNFFTAIYCLIFRRDHAIKAYSQNIEGRPFSTMLTCIPTTYHAFHRMMDEDAYWIGRPLLVVNLNVSWMRYAALWLLERMPETFDLAEKMGADPVAIDEARTQHVAHFDHWLNDIYLNQSEPNFEYFSLQRLIIRFKHIQAFRDLIPRLMEIYAYQRAKGAKGTEIPTNEMFGMFI